MKVCDICGTEATFDLTRSGFTPECREKQEQLIGHFCAVHSREIEDFIAREKKVWEKCK